METFQARLIPFGTTLAEWTVENPIPFQGEFVFEAGATPTDFKFKIGDGITPYLSLPYQSSGSGGTQNLQSTLNNGNAASDSGGGVNNIVLNDSSSGFSAQIGPVISSATANRSFKHPDEDGVYSLQGNNTTPTFTLSSNCGVGAFATIGGDNKKGFISITTGASGTNAGHLADIHLTPYSNFAIAIIVGDTVDSAPLVAFNLGGFLGPGSGDIIRLWCLNTPPTSSSLDFSYIVQQ